MLAKVLSSAVLGVDAYLVAVEVDIALGLPTFNTVGLPDVAVKESRDRVKAAIKNSGFEFPAKRITVNLAPADIKKEGAAFDLPTAIGILAAEELVRPGRLSEFVILGELSLDGSVRPIRGALSMAVAARESNLTGPGPPHGLGLHAGGESRNRHRQRSGVRRSRLSLGLEGRESEAHPDPDLPPPVQRDVGALPSDLPGGGVGWPATPRLPRGPGLDHGVGPDVQHGPAPQRPAVSHPVGLLPR